MFFVPSDNGQKGEICSDLFIKLREIKLQFILTVVVLHFTLII